MGRGLTLSEDGAEHIPSALCPTILTDISTALASQSSDRAGTRLFALAGLQRFLQADGAIGSIATFRLGVAVRAVRAILFDKTLATNWALPWHQDRTIAVRQKIEVDGFGPWSRKQGVLHVEPPSELLARMLTLRLHLDPVDADNAPLLIAPGSHRLGRLAEPDIPAVVARCGSHACLAEVGDGWIYATAILHASEAAAQPRRRRVLQIDFAAEDLPGGLEWLGLNANLDV